MNTYKAPPQRAPLATLKQTAAGDLPGGVREASEGDFFFSPAVSQRLMEHYRRTLKGLVQAQGLPKAKAA